MNTTVKPLAITTASLLVPGTLLLASGYLMELAAPPHSGANIGAGGAFLFGLGLAVAGLLLGVATTVVWLRTERNRRPDLLPWQKRLHWLNVVAAALFAAGAVVETVSVTILLTRHGGGLSRVYPLGFTGMGLAACGLLAAVPAIVLWWSWRRTGRHLGVVRDAEPRDGE